MTWDAAVPSCPYDSWAFSVQSFPLTPPHMNRHGIGKNHTQIIRTTRSAYYPWFQPCARGVRECTIKTPCSSRYTSYSINTCKVYRISSKDNTRLSASWSTMTSCGIPVRTVCTAVSVLYFSKVGGTVELSKISKPHNGNLLPSLDA